MIIETSKPDSAKKLSYFAMDKSDVKEVVKIHNYELNLSVLTLFGSAFLRRMYLVLLKKGNWGFVVKLEGNIIGFIFASKSEISFFRCLSITSIFFFLINSIRNPMKFISFLFLLKEFYLRFVKNKSFSRETMIELFNFAVKKNYQGGGIGKKLIKNLEVKAKASGFTQVFTRTHNEKLSDYYIKNKNATVIKKIKTGTQGSMILKWKI